MTYAVVQDFRASVGGSTNASSPPIGTISANNCLAYFVYFNNAGVPSTGVTLSDSANLISNWVEVGNVKFASGDELHWGYAKNTPAGTTTFSATLAGGQSVTNLACYLVELSGIDLTTPFLTGGAASNQTVSPGTATNAIRTNLTSALSFSSGAVIFGVCVNPLITHHAAPLAGSTYTSLASMWAFGQGAGSLCARAEHHRLIASQTPIQGAWSVDTTSLDPTGVDTYLSMAIVLAEPFTPPGQGSVVLSPNSPQLIAGFNVTPSVA